MARKTGRGFDDVSRYTGTSSRPPSFDQSAADDSISSATSFFLISIVVFLAIAFGAIYFGTQKIENDLEARSTESLQAAGFSLVEADASGATVHLSGSIDMEQSEEAAFAAVERVAGVRAVDGKLWPVFTGELQEIVVTGDAIELTWSGNSVSVKGNVESEERVTFVIETLSTTFSSVDVNELTILEGLAEESGWLGTTLGLMLSLQPDLTEGRMIIDPNGELLVVAGEVEGNELRNDLNGKVAEVAGQLGYAVNPAIRVLQIGPTEEEIEELQVELDALILDKVVEFETKSFELTTKGSALLDEILTELAKAPEVRVLITGHTDSRGAAGENQQLSEDRANAVLVYLVAAGESPSRFDVIGYGEDRPKDTNDTAEGRSRNRRIEFTALEGTS